MAAITEFLNDLNPIVILVAALFAAVFLWVVPFISYPFVLFFTTIHELGHILATGFTGGEAGRFVVNSDGSGLATRRGGADLVVIPAGYVGTALFSALLILLSGYPTAAQFSLGLVAALFVLLVVLFGFSSCLALSVGLAFGGGLLWVASQASPVWSVFMLNLLAIQGGLRSLDDLLKLRQWTSRYASRGDDDASKMAERVGCSPAFWATIWFLWSVLILGTAIWITWFRDLWGSLSIGF